jgi:hypothetical protein
MRRFLISGMASCLLAASLWVSPAFAQRRNDPNAEDKERPPPALQYTVAALSTIVILVILCMPSRKRSVS